MDNEVRAKIHELLDACIDRTEEGTDVWFEFTPHVKWVEWRTEAQCNYISYEDKTSEELKGELNCEIKKARSVKLRTIEEYEAHD
jgi:hypothetical protein